MPSVRCSGLEFAFSDGVPLLRDVTMHLEPGWYGLVAENGAGKTTFLRLLLGELAPDRGVIRCDGKVALCRQLCDGWGDLSPGERKRRQVTAALAEKPEVFLLDEPSNHLDAATRESLAGELASFTGVGIVVSHDRALLDRLTSETLRIEGGRLTRTRGNYSTAQALWQAEGRRRQNERDDARAQVRRLERRLDQQRRQQEAAARDYSTGRRMRNRHDSDARTLSAHTRVEWATANLGRQVGATQSQLERARADATGVATKTLGSTVFARYQPARRPTVLALDHTTVEASGRPLLRDVTVAVHRTDKVWLAGRNGAGKTTLLSALMRAHTLPPEKILHLPQELSEDEGRTLIEEVRAAPPEERGRTLSVVAALGSDPARLLATRCPSPGEARKLAIALGLGRHVWALVLDEPTNHLDLPSVERLEAALAAFPGALLLVTHDEPLARRCTNLRWEVRDGEIVQA